MAKQNIPTHDYEYLLQIQIENGVSRATAVEIIETMAEVIDDWLGLDLFNDDTRPSGHISSPSQVGFSHSCLHSINEF